MNTDWTPESLAAFERDVADTFNRGEIRAPVHLAGGNERQLIDLFKRVGPQDWVCGTWRSHYHCLLKGVPPAELKAAIVAGRSIALCFPEQRVVCSALVGGIAPVALGLAWAAKRRFPGFPQEFVWCFIGDMAASAGIVHECDRYARGHDLPLRFVVEDNGKSVSTDTAASWGDARGSVLGHHAYKSELTWPHVGTGTFVHFPDKAEHKSHGL
jgi:TPP-dependent pyruvate/acetoin dehydrogenase alpha subunit